MPSHSIVQSVLLRRSAFKTLDEAKKWITEHGYKYTLPDVTPTYYRFRQHDPAPLALTHRLRTTQLGEPDKMSPMGSVGALIIAYPKTSSPLAPKPPKPSALVKATQNPDVAARIAALVGPERSEAREVIQAEPKLIRLLLKSGDLAYLADPKGATVIRYEDGNYVMLPNGPSPHMQVVRKDAMNYFEWEDWGHLEDSGKMVDMSGDVDRFNKLVKKFGFSLGWFRVQIDKDSDLADDFGMKAMVDENAEEEGIDFDEYDVGFWGIEGLQRNPKARNFLRELYALAKSELAKAPAPKKAAPAGPAAAGGGKPKKKKTGDGE